VGEISRCRVASNECGRKGLGPKKWGELFFVGAREHQGTPTEQNKAKTNVVGIHERKCPQFLVIFELSLTLS